MAMPSSEASMIGSPAASRKAHLIAISPNNVRAPHLAAAIPSPPAADPDGPPSVRIARAARAATNPSHGIERLGPILTNRGRYGRLACAMRGSMARRNLPECCVIPYCTRTTRALAGLAQGRLPYNDGSIKGGGALGTCRGSMKVILAQPRGYCAGVVRAIEIVERALQKYGPPVYVRHEIVHNKHVVESLKAKGARFVEELSGVPPNSVTIFSAHGVDKSVED